MREPKWTHELRRIMFERLVREFGSYDTWGKSEYPSGRKKRYAEVLDELRNCFECLTGKSFATDAIEQQIAFGFTKQQSRLGSSHARSFILNKAAALEAGFIKTRQLQSLLLQP